MCAMHFVNAETSLKNLDDYFAGAPLENEICYRWLGAANPPPAFASGGESVTTKFEKGDGNTWKITAFAEMSNESRGTDVTASQLKVYRASSLEGLKTAEAMTSGVTLTEKTSAVKVTLEAEAPTDAEQQFFRVDFGE